MRFESLTYFYKNQSTFLSNSISNSDTIVLPMWLVLDEQLDEKRIKEKIALIR